MISATRGRAASSGLRHLSLSSTKNNANTEKASASSASAAPPLPPSANTSSSDITNTTTLPPWLNRWLNLWDQESGTHEILALKEQVNASSLAFDAKQHQVSQARTSLDRALQSFEDSQLQHTSLLQSRDRWTPSQAMELAKLLEKEVAIRQELNKAKKQLSTLEGEQRSSLNTYMNHLRRRYHEEQVWQDKWRIYSTFGTWGLIVLNTMVFLISQWLYRMRESQRLKDVKGLLEQSLMMNEGTLKVIQEQQQQQQHQKEVMQHQMLIVEDESEGGEVRSQQQQHEDKTEQSTATDEREANATGAVGGSKENVEAALPSPHPQNRSQSSHWTRIRQYTASLSKKLLSEKREVDVPSAILGASVTGIAWIAAVALSSCRKGAQ